MQADIAAYTWSRKLVGLPCLFFGVFLFYSLYFLRGIINPFFLCPVQPCALLCTVLYGVNNSKGLSTESSARRKTSWLVNFIFMYSPSSPELARWALHRIRTPVDQVSISLAVTFFYGIVVYRLFGLTVKR